MTRRRLAASWIVFLCCVGVALPIAARNRSGSSRVDADLEMLLGHYQCYVDPEDGTGWQSLVLDATGDVFLDEVSLLDQPVETELPADECGATRAGQMLETAEGAGCDTSEVESLGAGQVYFRFICTGSRGRVVRAIAGMAETLYRSAE